MIIASLAGVYLFFSRESQCQLTAWTHRHAYARVSFEFCDEINPPSQLDTN
jgi:hypothetical protein